MPFTSTRNSHTSRHSGLSRYYPFGMQMQGREFAGGMGYRYGFGSQESDNEVSGRGNSYTAEFWQYDCRLGRRWNLDPVPQISLSDYSVNGNNPILNIDPNGAYFFGLFGSTKEQRQTAEYTASRLGGKVNNLHSKSISVKYFTQEGSHDESGLVTIKAIGHVIGFDKNGNSTNRYGIRTEYNWRHEYVISRKIANGHLVNVGTVEVPQFVATGKLDDPEIDPVTLAIGIPALARAFINSSATVAIGRAGSETAKIAAETSTSVIEGFTQHATNQAVTRGFKTADILKIVREGTPVQAAGRYGTQTRYTLGGNTVVVNAQGKVVTVFSNAPGTAKGLGKGHFIPFE